MGQEQARRSEAESEEDQHGRTSEPTRRTAGGAAVEGVREADVRDADVDAILDEIDEVLEENAEVVVGSFVQRGGQ